MHLHLTPMDFIVFAAFFFILKLALVLATTRLDSDSAIAKALAVLS